MGLEMRTTAKSSRFKEQRRKIQPKWKWSFSDYFCRDSV